MKKEKLPQEQSKTYLIEKILFEGTDGERRALFAFDVTTPKEEIRIKFTYWSRFFFPKFFSSKDALFHSQMDLGNIGVYLNGSSFLNIAFRGSSKTTRTKLFIAFCIANDIGHYRRYFKVLSKDLANAKQSTTDVYNMLISKRVRALYPEIFQKTTQLREETMGSFTTATGIKMTADTIGTDQRGDIQDESRPDFVFFDDIETRISLMSAQITFKIWQNIDEAVTGLSKDGGAVYCCNYISERGNVHKLVEKIQNKVIIPIEENGIPTWDRYTKDDIARIKHDVEDYEGDYLCKPSASRDVYFDRESVDRQVAKPVIEEIAGLKIFKKWQPANRTAGGFDIAGGVGLDSSTSVFIDFDCIPAQVIATYKNNEIKPDTFAHEIARQGKRFGECYVAPEKNYGSTLDILKTIYPTSQIHKTQRGQSKIEYSKAIEYGWETNGLTKGQMLADFDKALEDNLISLNDPDLIAEARSYTRNDMMDKEVDARLTTRHFDILTACFVKGTMVLTDKGQRPIETLVIGDRAMTRDGYKKITAVMSLIKPVITNIGLTGTLDHPVFCNGNKIKDLSAINKGDILYVWDSKAQKIERLSYTKAQRITDTQKQRKETTGSILWEGLNGKRTESIYIEKFGLIISGVFQRGCQYIIKTTILLITLLKTFVYSLKASICDFIWKNQKEENTSVKYLIGKRIGLNKERVYKILSPLKNLMYSSVIFVEKSIRALPIMPSFALGYAHNELGERGERNQKWTEYVSFVVRNSKLVFHTKRDARQNVPLADQENDQRVYNLEVEGCPEYFANNILVHNCCIAWAIRDFVNKPEVNVFDYYQPQDEISNNPAE